MKAKKGQEKKAAGVESASSTAAENNKETMMALYGIKTSPKQGAVYWSEMVHQGNENQAKTLDKHEKKDELVDVFIPKKKQYCAEQ